MSGRERPVSGRIRVGGTTPQTTLIGPFYEQTGAIRVGGATSQSSLIGPFYEQTRCIRIGRPAWFDDFTPRAVATGWSDPDEFPHTGTLDLGGSGFPVTTGQWGGYDNTSVWDDPAASVSGGDGLYATASATAFTPSMGVLFLNPWTFPLEVLWDFTPSTSVGTSVVLMTIARWGQGGTWGPANDGIGVQFYVDAGHLWAYQSEFGSDSTPLDFSGAMQFDLGAWSGQRIKCRLLVDADGGHLRAWYASGAEPGTWGSEVPYLGGKSIADWATITYPLRALVWFDTSYPVTGTFHLHRVDILQGYAG